MGGVQKAVETIETVGQNIINNPLPVVETIALTSVGVDPSLASAAVTYANGGSVEDAAKSGVVSFAGQQAGEAYTSATTEPGVYDYGDVPTTTGLPASTEKAGVSGAASGATKAALSGGSAGDIVKGAAVGGLSSGGADYISDVVGNEPGSVSDTLTKTFAKQSLSNILGGGSKTSPASSVPVSQSDTSVTTTGAGQAPGSQALGQALRIGDAGSPIFGGDKDKEGKKSGWNVESLRYMNSEA